jgi:hypothetical protein
MSDDEVEIPVSWQEEYNGYGIEEWENVDPGTQVAPETRRPNRKYSASYSNLDQVFSRPWQMPGADINKWFNFGFTEETWFMFCQNQLELQRQAVLEEYKLGYDQDQAKSANRRPPRPSFKERPMYKKRRFDDPHVHEERK